MTSSSNVFTVNYMQVKKQKMLFLREKLYLYLRSTTFVPKTIYITKPIPNHNVWHTSQSPMHLTDIYPNPSRFLITWLIYYRFFADLHNQLTLLPSGCVPKTSPSSAEKKGSCVSSIMLRIINNYANFW